ncbi:MAG: HAMP domain-containing histidine kinase [Pseudomonadota bacterium]|nr:HAMP domain-containing histidine kinase [Pseudomonadota bacterium]
MPGSHSLTLRPWARSALVRLSFIYTALFGISTVAALFAVYVFAAAQLENQTRGLIADDIAWAEDSSQFAGEAVLRDAVTRRSRANAFDGAFYLMVDKTGTRLAGSLERWPERAPRTVFPKVFPLAVSDTRAIKAMGATVTLKNGDRILVVRSLDAVRETLMAAMRYAFAGVLLIVLVGMTGGLLMARSVLRRIARINEVCGKVEDGDLAVRVADDGHGDEITATAQHINAMLGRIEGLVEDVHSLSVRVAHELRTPLSRLRALLERGEQQSKDEADADIFTESKEQVDEVVTMFEALLELSVTRSGLDDKAAFVRLRLRDVVEDALSLYDALAEDHGNAITQDIATDAEVVGARDLLFRMLANLLENAIKFSPKGKEITVRVFLHADRLGVEILDSGAGFPPDIDVRTLKPFRRGTNSAKVAGHGVGLSLAKAIAIRHGGTLEISNRPEGGGRVAVVLPMAPPQKSVRDAGHAGP